MAVGEALPIGSGDDAEELGFGGAGGGDEDAGRGIEGGG